MQEGDSRPARTQMSLTTAAVGRFDRSRGRSIESIGSVGSVILRIFQFFRHVGELEICLVSKFQLCTTLGGRKNAEKPKRKFSEFFGSVGSVFRSVRSILRPRVVVDRSEYLDEGDSSSKKNTRKGRHGRDPGRSTTALGRNVDRTERNTEPTEPKK